jgi:plastocyanin
MGMRKNLSQAVLLLVSLTVLFSTASQATVHRVNVGNFFFSPLKTVVEPGDTVRWILIAGVHTSTSLAVSPKIWNSGILVDSFDLKFTIADGPGPFPYICTVHPVTMIDTIFMSATAFNAHVNPLTGPGREDLNPSVAYSDSNGVQDVYAVWNAYLTVGFAPTNIGWGYSAALGAPGSWTNTILPPSGPFNSEWNPDISGQPRGFLLVNNGHFFPPYIPGPPNGILMSVSPGFGAAFGPEFVIISGGPNINWFDYPRVQVDNYSPTASSNFGTGHISWTEYIDANADANGNGNFFDDAGDIFRIWATYTNLLAGPFPYPAVAPPVVIGGGTVMSDLMPLNRSALALVTSPLGTPTLPQGGVYAAWIDGPAGVIFIDGFEAVSPIPWGSFGPIPANPIAPVPPVTGGPIKISSSVDIAVDNGTFSPCLGNIHLVWTEFTGLDADIFFSTSGDGGFTWSPPVRVNQDPPGTRADQWSPSIEVDTARGEICVTYYDRRRHPGFINIEVYTSRSRDCGATWVDGFLSDAGPVPPITSIVGAPYIAPYIGDYLGTDLSHTPFGGMQLHGSIWNDGRNGIDQEIWFAEGCSCCEIRGDFDHSGGVNVADLTAMVAYLFQGGPPPFCFEEADVDGSGSLDVADVTFLVAYLFMSGPPPPPC